MTLKFIYCLKSLSYHMRDDLALQYSADVGEPELRQQQHRHLTGGMRA